MSKKEDGGLAFPLHYEVFEKSEMMVHHEGMSLRDYFAMRATEKDIEKHCVYVTSDDPGDFIMTATYTREQARYRFADAMIKEKNK